MKKSWWLEIFIVVVLVGGAVVVLRQRSRTPALAQLGVVVLPADIVQSGTGRDRRGDHLYALCANGVLYEIVVRRRHPQLVPLVQMGNDYPRLVSATSGFPQLRGWDFNRDGVEEVALAAEQMTGRVPPSFYRSLRMPPAVCLVYERAPGGRFVRNSGYEKQWTRKASEWRAPLVNRNPQVDGMPFVVSAPVTPFIPPPTPDWFSRLFPALSHHFRRPNAQEVTCTVGGERQGIGYVDGIVAWVNDLDGDGSDEIVTYNHTRPQAPPPSYLEYHLYRYAGGRFREVWRDRFLEHQGNSTFIVDISDLDNDGMRELVFIEPVNRRGIVMGLSPKYWGRSGIVMGLSPKYWGRSKPP